MSSSERQGNADSDVPALSSTGRYVAYSSVADNLVRGDSNAARDVFVRDRRRGTTQRVSLGSRGQQGDADSGFTVAINANGRYVAFLSNAGNLAPVGSEQQSNVFVRDRWRHNTKQVNVSSQEVPANYSASWGLSISSSGRYVAFISAASNLVSGDTNEGDDAFVRDRWRGTTTRASVTPGGQEFPGGIGTFDVDISGNGRYVAFTDDTGLYVRDRLRGSTARVADGGQGQLSWSGRRLAFQSCAEDVVPGDTNEQCDAFVHNLRRGTTRLVSLSSKERQSDGGSYVPQISPDGRYVSFVSDASNLVGGDTNGGQDIFIRDLRAGRTVRVNVGYQGQATGGNSFGGALSQHGRNVAYRSEASNLVPRDTNNSDDVFVTRWRELG